MSVPSNKSPSLTEEWRFGESARKSGDGPEFLTSPPPHLLDFEGRQVWWQTWHVPLTSITKSSYQTTGSVTSSHQHGPIFGGITSVNPTKGAEPRTQANGSQLLMWLREERQGGAYNRIRGGEFVTTNLELFNVFSARTDIYFREFRSNNLW